MVNPVMKDGVLILFNSTLGANQDCCCPVGDVSEEYEPCICPETCPTLGEFVNPPSIQLTVFDADYAGGDINWCGETWTQAQVLAGESRCVCPTIYNKGNFDINNTGTPAATFNGYPSAALHRWKYGTDQLALHRADVYQYGGPTYYLVYTRSNYLRVFGDKDKQRFRNTYQSGMFSPPLPVTGTTTDYSAINKVIGLAEPSLASYDLLPAFFGSHIISGVTYTWAKGARWN